MYIIYNIYIYYVLVCHIYMYVYTYIYIYIYIPPLTVSDVRITKASSTSFRWVSGLGFRV